jgi:predicted unusual protein kinase regulating ubiquinone biosynthesis (AarF/ABC1/UbiB family)
MLFRVRLEMYRRRSESRPGPTPTTIPGPTPPTGREHIVDRMTPTSHQTTPAPADLPDLGVAAGAVNATKVHGKGDAEVGALDDVTVDLATSRFAAIMGLSGSPKSTLRHARAGLVSLRRLFVVAAAVSTIIAGATWDRLSRRRASFDAILARRVRRAFERLGPTFVKAGQLMSSSPGSFPKAWVDEMAHCRDEVPPARWKAISQLLADELGERREELAEINPEPIAAGSMAQVHAAVLGDGTPVVVKVQRPGLRKVLTADIALLRIIARLLARLSRTCAAANPVALVNDFATGLNDQLSFRREAANVQRMGIALASLTVHVPKVVTDLSTDRVLVMERLEGVRADDINGVNELGLDRSAIVRTVMASLILPAMREGIFHGDMHAGNMLVLPNGRIGLLDFGVLGHLDAPSRDVLCDLLVAVVDRRFGDVALALFGVIDVSGVDQPALVQEARAFLAAHLDTSLARLDLCAIITGILGIAARNGCRLRDSLVSFIKQLLYIDGVCRELDPDFEVLGDARPIISMARDTKCASAHDESTSACLA